MMNSYLPAFGDCVSIEFDILNCFPERTKNWRENPHALPRNLPRVVHLLRVLVCEIFVRVGFASHDIIVFWEVERSQERRSEE